MEETKEKAIYAGKRINGENVRECFLLGTRELFFKGPFKWLCMGNYYFIFVKGDHISIASRPEDQGPSGTDEETIELWQAKHSAAIEFQKRKRASAKSGKMSLENYKVKDLRRIYDKLSFEEKHAFLAAVSRSIAYERKEKK